jgi:hypothetical protein
MEPVPSSARRSSLLSEGELSLWELAKEAGSNWLEHKDARLALQL